ncbi:MAG: hypothetical protein KatS3mg131_3545 [Candidatus Tectimicrobiota bacterium]|nr:MAG: hypothetical protein KatS3mg131_3545 [Candidatus Tectomicrobia bacterium]
MVLVAFLAFAGLGSRYAARVVQRLPAARLGRPLALAAGASAGLALLLLGLLPWLQPRALAWPLSLKGLLTLTSLAPLAFCMGMPFPLGLARVAAAVPAWLPWAWGINGCASVLGRRAGHFAGHSFWLCRRHRPGLRPLRRRGAAVARPTRRRHALG